jgi:hypothetical protein
MEYLGAGEQPPQARLLALQRLADELAADADRPVTMATTLATRRQSAVPERVPVLARGATSGLSVSVPAQISESPSRRAPREVVPG